MSKKPETTKKHPHVHPLPGLSWIWIAGCISLAGLGAIWIAAASRQDVNMIASAMPPTLLQELQTAGTASRIDQDSWNRVLAIGAVTALTGVAYGWLWYRFTIQRKLDRRTWNAGVGLIVAGAAALFVTGWFVPAAVFLLMLAVWGGGFTRKHFDKL